MIRILTCLLLLVITTAAYAAPAQISKGGKPLMPIIVAPDAAPPATQEVATKSKGKPPVRPLTQQDHAKTLAAQLQAITGGQFEVKTSTSPDAGIVVGTLADFPSLKLDSAFSADPLERGDQYIIKTHDKGVYIIADTPRGVQNGIWDFLYRIGYRQFFPGKAWEVVPSAPDLTADIDTNQKPAYAFRNIWYGYGTWDTLQPQSKAWQAKNRAPGEFQLNSGHSFDGFIHKNEAIFKQHPEYYGLWEGKRNSTKICIGNTEVVKLFIAFTDAQFTERPGIDSVSVDPSDGGKWCQCELCQAIGSPSDRVLTLANSVAEMIAKKYPGKYVAFYAYNEHALPPTKVKARPEVIVNVATAFTRGSKIDDIIEGWLKAGVKTFGIREYYSVFAWDMDLPGSGRGAKLDYLTHTIPHYRKLGARFLSAESGDNWGPHGLGYYIATRVMWDITEADRLEAIKDDFFTKAFGKAQEPMRVFYDVLLNTKPAPLSADKVGRLYRQLDLAYKTQPGPAVVKRLDDLLGYVRYVELYREMQDTPATEQASKNAPPVDPNNPIPTPVVNARLIKFEEIARHVYRNRFSFMNHSLAVWRASPRSYGNLVVPKEFHFQIAESKHPWKQDQPYTREELDRILARGIAANPLFNFSPMDFSTDLVPLPAGVKLPEKGFVTPMPSFATRGAPVYYVFTTKANQVVTATVTTGQIVGYRDRGPADVWIEEFGETEEFGPIAKTSVPPDGEPHQVSFTIKEPGLYRLRINDKGIKSTLEAPKNLPMAIPSGLTTHNNTQGRTSGYFYVPKGTKVVGGFIPANEGEILTPDGKVIRNFQGKGREYFDIPVPPGMDGKFWGFQKVVGEVRLMTVPAYFFRDLESVLLPEEVVKKDFGR